MIEPNNNFCKHCCEGWERCPFRERNHLFGTALPSFIGDASSVWFLADEKLPEEYEMVLIYIPKRPWSHHRVNNIFFKTAWLVKGISEKEREALPDTCKRKHEIRPEDEYGNNHVPYYWDSFGPDSYFGQEVVAWAYIRPPKRS